jgi:hypothetical protein
MTTIGAILTRAICLGQFIESKKLVLFIKEILMTRTVIEKAAILTRYAELTRF